MKPTSEGITLVIGGMGIKGAASIGVLQALRDHEVKITRIVATGISALAGAQFSLERDLDVLTSYLVNSFQKNRGYLWGMERLTGLPPNKNRRVRDSFSYYIRASRFCKTNALSLSIFPWEAVDGDLKELFGDVVFSQLKVPLAISAIDLTRGEEVLLEKGGIVDPLKAGISFPGIIPPVRIGDGEFVTSTLYCELPLGKLNETDGPIVAINIPRNPTTQRPVSALETIAQMDELRSAAIKRKLLAKATIVFSLDSLREFQWDNYDQIPQMITEARQEMDRLLT